MQSLTRRHFLQLAAVTGASLSRDGELIHANGVGVRNLDTGAPMTPQSVMSMGLVDFVLSTLGKLRNGEI